MTSILGTSVPSVLASRSSQLHPAWWGSASLAPSARTRSSLQQTRPTIMALCLGNSDQPSARRGVTWNSGQVSHAARSTQLCWQDGRGGQPGSFIPRRTGHSGASVKTLLMVTTGAELLVSWGGGQVCCTLCRAQEAPQEPSGTNVHRAEVKRPGLADWRVPLHGGGPGRPTHSRLGGWVPGSSPGRSRPLLPPPYDTCRPQHTSDTPPCSAHSAHLSWLPSLNPDVP